MVFWTIGAALKLFCLYFLEVILDEKNLNLKKDIFILEKSL